MEIWRQHGLKIVAAGAVILILVLVGDLLGAGGGAGTGVSSRPAASGKPAPALPLGSKPFENNHEGGAQVRPVPPAGSQEPAVQTAVRGFMAHYLPFTYGQARASALTNVTADERQSLAATAPQVPAAIRKRHARAVRVGLKPYAAGEWEASVTVSDGTLTYSIAVIVGDVSGRWTVMAIQS